MNYDNDPRLPALIKAYRSVVPMPARMLLAWETEMGAATMAKAFLAMHDALNRVKT